MGKINIKFDNKLKQSDIIVPLTNSSVKESGPSYIDNQPEIQQTLVYGIQAPLIMINRIVVDFNEVIDFNLKSVGPLPSLSMTVRDRFGLINTLDNPNLDNEIRIQILPKFEKAYKKINLTFYISNVRINNDMITVTGLYKLPKLSSSIFKSFGDISMYKLCESIANETGLGFASNISNSNDNRYIYCDNKSYIELLSREITHSSISSSQDKLQVLDWWVDMWNNLNLVDIYERYNSTDSDEDMKIWVSNQPYDMKEGDVIVPIQTLAVITNHPSMRNTELFTNKIDIHNKTGAQLISGTDRVYSVYFDGKFEHFDHMIQDGDVKKDIFTKYEYLGEVYGDYNYLMAEKIRSTFMQKINSESVEVTLNFPLLALIRGNKVNLVKYINDSMLESKKTNLNKENAINTNDAISNDNDSEFKIDESISGQYLITSSNIKYSKGNWEYTLVLNRPNSLKPKILKNVDE